MNKQQTVKIVRGQRTVIELPTKVKVRITANYKCKVLMRKEMPFYR